MNNKQYRQILETYHKNTRQEMYNEFEKLIKDTALEVTISVYQNENLQDIHIGGIHELERTLLLNLQELRNK